MSIFLRINTVNCALFVRHFFRLITDSQEMLKILSICMHARSQSLSLLVVGFIGKVLLQTARHQQGAASAHRQYSYDCHTRSHCCITPQTSLSTGFNTINNVLLITVLHLTS